MSVVFTDYDNIAVDEWLALLKESKFSSPFQTPAYFKFFNKIPNYKSFVIATGDEKEIKTLVSGVIISEPGIQSWFSRRAIIEGGPIFGKDDNIYNRMLLNALYEFLKDKVIYIEIRNQFNYSEFKPLYEELCWKYEPHLNFIVDCSNRDNVINNLSKSRWRQIKKSLKNGAKIIPDPNPIEINAFYEILINLYKSKVKKPLPPREFFQKFTPEFGKYFLIEFNGSVVGGIMCPISKDYIYELYVAGLDRECSEIYPSILATWAAIDYANKNGIKYFDFMGAGKPNEDYSVRDFKARFGGKQVEFGRFLHVNNPFLFKTGKLGLQLIKKLN